MDLEELAAKVATLENANAAAQQESRLNDFMSAYGTKFNNKPSTGAAILGELDRRGIGQDAMANAVQEVLDQIRAESILVRDQAQQLIDDLTEKVDAVQEAVEAATGEVGPASQVMPAVDDVPVPTPPVPIPPPSMEAPPTPDTGPTQPPPVEAVGGPPPSPEASSPTVPPVQQPVISDARLKELKSRVEARQKQKTMPRPKAHILGVLAGGMR